jgi:hypothetical protein
MAGYLNFPQSLQSNGRILEFPQSLQINGRILEFSSVPPD